LLFSDKELYCVTTQLQNQNRQLSLNFSMDDYRVEFVNIKLEYVDDPNIASISRNKTIIRYVELLILIFND
jgi:hypothetical protein